MLAAFLEHWAGPSDVDGAALEEALRAAHALAQSEWSALQVDPDAFAAFLAAKVATDANPITHLESLQVGDLYLVCAVIAGDETALAGFDAELLPEVAAVARKLRIGDDALDELAQDMRERLLVGVGERGPRLIEYAGKGPLGRWMEATALRLQLNKTRGKKREVLVDSEPILDALLGAGSAADPMRGRYHGAFTSAFTAALETLDAESKLILRMAYLDRVGLDGLGRALGVSRATAHRRLTRARELVAAATETRLQGELAISADQLASIRRLVQSQISVSMRRLLS